MDEIVELNAAESALLLACARTHVDEAGRAHIAELVSGPVRWKPLVDAGAAHGVLPLLHVSLAGSPAKVPAQVLERIRLEARANVHHSLYLMSELRRLLSVFEREGVTAIPFKGPVLAAMAYGDVTLRQFTDLDIFVRKSELATITRLMLDNGYLSDAHDGAEATEHSIAADGEVAFHGPSYYTFYRADGRCRVDLQWRMADRFFAFTLDGGGIGWDFTGVSLAGRSVRTFSATDTLLILCVHGSKHQWEHLKWICDVAECIRARREAIDWSTLQRKAMQLRAGRMLSLGLALAETLLGASLPPEVSARLRTDRSLKALVRERRAALFERAAPPSTLPQLLFYMKTKDGWREQARFGATYARQFVARMVKPNERDLAWVTLPPRLEPLYYLLRPARVLATYASRARWPARRRSSSAPADERSPTLPQPAAKPTTQQGARKC